MAAGWAQDGAVEAQIQDSVAEEIERARLSLHTGSSLEFCENCGGKIPEARRRALPGVRLCVACQKEEDGRQQRISHYNRRGSKDSQLR